MAEKWMQEAVPESHRGLFTAKAKRAKMGVQEFAAHVLAHPSSYPRRTVHQALFAKNAAGVAKKD